jgi:formyltetrahydrofolate synthetase
MRMPGLPASPQAERIDLVDGKVVGVTPGGPPSPASV